MPKAICSCFGFSSCTEFAASLSIDRSSYEGSRDRTCVAVLNSIWKIKFFIDERPLVHYTLQFSLDCITGVSEGERKKWRRGHGVSTCYLHYRRKLKFHYMLTPLSFNPLLPFVLTHLAVTRCKFQLKSVLSRGTTQ